MKAYNETHLRNRHVVAQAERWHRQGLLTDAQLDAVQRAFPHPFQRNNTFVEIGAFIFTLVAVAGGYALLALLLDVAFLRWFGLIDAALAAGLALLTNYLIRTRHLYHNGVDNALVLDVAVLAIAAVADVFPAGTSLWAYCAVALPVLVAVVWYYGDTIVAFLLLATVYVLVADLTLDLGGRPVLPFVLLALSAALYYVVTNMVKPALYYVDAFTLAEWFTLSALLLSSNYYVVRALNNLLLERPLPEAAPPPFGGVFWVTTFLVPAVYLFFGFRDKNRILLILGAIGGAGAVATVRYYVARLPLSIHLTLCGLVLVGGAVGLIRYLRSGPDGQRNGFTDTPDEDSPDHFFDTLETATTLHTAAGAPTAGQPASPRETHRFGGGTFGGAGSGDTY